MKRYAGKRVLVTGGTQGIGLAIANGFRTEGGTVTITGTRPAATDYATDLAAFSFVQMDGRNPESRARAVDLVGPIDVLVNNAGSDTPDEFSVAGFSSSLELNLVTPMDLSTRFQPMLARRAGSIVNIGSVVSFLALRDLPGYTAAKHGLLGLTRALADKWARDGVRVNLVAPGFIETGATEGSRADPDYEQRLMAAIPMRRWGRPNEVAGAALFLASAEASYITGSSIVIDGGLMLR